MLVIATLLAAVGVTVAGVIRHQMLRSGGGWEGFLPATNFRGRVLPRVGGSMIMTAFLSVEALFALVVLGNPGPAGRLGTALPDVFFSRTHLGVLVLVLGFFMLGLLDDAAGTGGSKGFRGHFGALARGKLTTGTVKAVGGASVALVAGSIWEDQLILAVLDALVVVLAANMLNLLDLRPGRAVKVFMLIWFPLTLVTWQGPYVPASSSLVAAAAVWLPADLREEAMLGDSGSNLLGAVAGAGLALSTTQVGKVGVIALLAVLTLASEKWSFTRIIERAAPLRWVDSLGRVREEI